MLLQQLALNGIIAGSIYTLVALGFTIIYRTVKFFHFAHGVVYTAGAYLAYTFAISLGLNFLLSFFLATILAAVLGLLIDKVVYSPLRQKKAPNLVFLIASFGVFIFIQNLIQLIYGAQMLTLMKYRPEFPERFGCYQDAHRFLTEFFPWYNHEHHHSGLGYLTPYEVHYGLAQQRRDQRAVVLQEAYERNPQRFVRGVPTPALLPTAAWINKPKEVPPTDSAQALNSSITGTEQKNGFHNCPITDATESGRGKG